MKLIDKDALVAEIERLVNNQDSALDYEAALEDVRNFLDTLEVKYLQEEPTFKVGDRIRIKGTTVKGDVIKNIYQAEGGNTYFEFENSDDALANEMWELVEDHKEFKPIRKKQPEGVLKELLDNMDEKELEDTRNAKIGVCKDNYVEFEDGTCIDFDPSMQLKPAFNVKDGDKVEVLLLKV